MLQPLLLAGQANPYIAQCVELVETAVSMDTETTGFKDRLIIEMAIFTPKDGRCVYNSLFNVHKQIEPGAFEVHGIRWEDLQGSPTIDKELSTIMGIINGRPVVAWNALSAEKSFMRASLAAYGIPEPPINWVCLMELYKKWAGLEKKCSQTVAAEALGVIPGNHRADGDCEALTEILCKMAMPPEDLGSITQSHTIRNRGEGDEVTITCTEFLGQYRWFERSSHENPGKSWLDPNTGRHYGLCEALDACRGRILGKHR